MEETLGNYAAVRLVFQRWMEWEVRAPKQRARRGRCILLTLSTAQPDEIGWNAYIKFEMRYGEADRARQVFRKFVVVHPKVATYLKWANFEQKLGEVANARAVFENCHEFLGADAETEEYFVAFAQFEESNHEVERARAIYRFALDRVDKARAAEIYRAYVAFEKQFGDRDGIETVIAGRRRFHFEEELKENPRNYDAWYDYAKLEEQYGANAEAVREVYERAIANVPPVAEKRFWRRYIWLWINYAVFEELSAQDVGRARAVWAECVRVVPHAQFSFTKVWTMYALFEVRHGDLSAARKVFGAGLGLAAKPKLFRNYLELETKLGEIDRVRKLYGALLERFPQHAQGWVDFAALEASLQEVVRTRAIFELAIQQQGMDTPELVWKSYIDWELESGRHAEARQLYGRLLGFTQHPRVFESFARFEYSLGNVEAARAVYVRGIDGDLKTEDTKNERWELLQLLKDFEDDVADAHKGEAQYDFIQQRMPKRVKKKRTNATGVVEEVYDYRFPDMEVSKPGAKLLEAAAAWKRAKTAEGGQPQ